MIWGSGDGPSIARGRVTRQWMSKGTRRPSGSPKTRQDSPPARSLAADADADAAADAPHPSRSRPKPNKNSITLFEQGPHGKLVGEDINGNRYYENNDLPYGECWFFFLRAPDPLRAPFFCLFTPLSPPRPPSTRKSNNKNRPQALGRIQGAHAAVQAQPHVHPARVARLDQLHQRL